MLSVKAPGAALPGHSVQLECIYSMDEDSLYAVKWYRGDDEFYRYVPAEEPPATVFSLDGINVDVSFIQNHLSVNSVSSRMHISDWFKLNVSQLNLLVY